MKYNVAFSIALFSIALTARSEDESSASPRIKDKSGRPLGSVHYTTSSVPRIPPKAEISLSIADTSQKLNHTKALTPWTTESHAAYKARVEKYIRSREKVIASNRGLNPEQVVGVHEGDYINFYQAAQSKHVVGLPSTSPHTTWAQIVQANPDLQEQLQNKLTKPWGKAALDEHAKYLKTEQRELFSGTDLIQKSTEFRQSLNKCHQELSEEISKGIQSVFPQSPPHSLRFDTEVEPILNDLGMVQLYRTIGNDPWALAIAKYTSLGYDNPAPHPKQPSFQLASRRERERQVQVFNAVLRMSANGDCQLPPAEQIKSALTAYKQEYIDRLQGEVTSRQKEIRSLERSPAGPIDPPLDDTEALKYEPEYQQHD